MAQSSTTSPLHWFLRLRWIAFFGQIAVLALALFFYKLQLPWQKIGLVLLLIPTGDLIFRVLKSRFSTNALTAALLLSDVLILTLVLSLSGGPSNPFSLVYLVHVVLSAVLLGKTWTWLMAATSSLCYLSLFYFSKEVADMGSHHQHHQHQEMSFHLQGMFFSYVLVAFLISYFLTRIVDEKKRQERRAERLASEQRQLASMTTLSANTAHELGTPLSTISLVAHELERSLSNFKLPESNEIHEDIQLLQQESARCREILDELSSSAGNVVGEPTQSFLVRQFLEDLESLHGCKEVEFKLLGDAPEHQSLFLPKKAIQTALKSLIRNAIEAQSETLSKEKVCCEFSCTESFVSFRVLDRGPGISPEITEQIGQPFLSKKKSGMGLGLYIANLVAEHLDGKLLFLRRNGGGTEARLDLPREVQRRAA